MSPLGTVLIVDDEALVLELAQAEFEDAGFTVLTASDGCAALDRLSEGTRIDLLFTDIRFPGPFDGWAVAAKARELDPRISVIYATGYSDRNPQPVAGSRLFLKPYRMEEVIGTAREFLRS